MAGGAVAEQALQRARDAVARELLFDVQTTEDAAHQLAFFGGMDALTVLTGLPAAVEAVQAAELKRALDSWLRPSQRTIGWYLPRDAEAAVAAATPRPESATSSGWTTAAGPAARCIRTSTRT